MFKYFILVFALSFQVQAATFNERQSSSILVVDLQQAFTEFSEVYNLVTGHCSKSRQLSFTKNTANERLISVARQSVNFANTSYDRPGHLDMRYYGALSDEADSFGAALKHITGGRNFNYALQFFRKNNDEDSAKRLYVARENLQSLLAQLSLEERLLVYAGEATQSFGAFQFAVLLDPKNLEVAVFQAGWCE